MRFLAFVFALGSVSVACGGSSVIDGGSGGATNGSSSSSSGTSSSSTSGVGGSGAGGGGGGTMCNPKDVLCNSLPPLCPPGQVPSVDGACWGDCVPILDCAPESSCDDCQLGFCAEYVAFGVEYRCVAPSLMCSALACSCLAPYFCVSPYLACSETPMAGDVGCECTDC